ncbi:hypothetical protein C1645_828076 [Glomus cerebriforme]|uniref:Uncharacterized protein n=1 Tax=Glomus cerebriforme TaxID=658196 RepID=A0A397SWH1_9GLOM|nr:hypothetical protein C1645_828076 [Glomus cerebriforme]
MGVGIGAGLIITSIICPPLGEAMNAATLGTGIGMKVVGSLTDEGDLEEVGDIMTLGAEIGGVGNVANQAIQGPHTACDACKNLPKRGLERFLSWYCQRKY